MTAVPVPNVRLRFILGYSKSPQIRAHYLNNRQWVHAVPAESNGVVAAVAAAPVFPPIPAVAHVPGVQSCNEEKQRTPIMDEKSLVPIVDLCRSDVLRIPHVKQCDVQWRIFDAQGTIRSVVVIGFSFGAGEGEGDANHIRSQLPQSLTAVVPPHLIVVEKLPQQIVVPQQDSTLEAGATTQIALTEPLSLSSVLTVAVADQAQAVPVLAEAATQGASAGVRDHATVRPHTADSAALPSVPLALQSSSPSPVDDNKSVDQNKSVDDSTSFDQNKSVNVNVRGNKWKSNGGVILANRFHEHKLRTSELEKQKVLEQQQKELQQQHIEKQQQKEFEKQLQRKDEEEDEDATQHSYEYVQSTDLSVFNPGRYRAFHLAKTKHNGNESHLSRTQKRKGGRFLPTDQVGVPVRLFERHENVDDDESASTDSDAEADTSTSVSASASLSTSQAIARRAKNKKKRERVKRKKQQQTKANVATLAAKKENKDSKAEGETGDGKNDGNDPIVKKIVSMSDPESVMLMMEKIRGRFAEHYAHETALMRIPPKTHNGLTIFPSHTGFLDPLYSFGRRTEFYRIMRTFESIDMESIHELLSPSSSWIRNLFMESKTRTLTRNEFEKLQLAGIVEFLTSITAAYRYTGIDALVVSIWTRAPSSATATTTTTGNATATAGSGGINGAASKRNASSVKDRLLKKLSEHSKKKEQTEQKSKPMGDDHDAFEAWTVTIPLVIHCSESLCLDLNRCHVSCPNCCLRFCECESQLHTEEFCAWVVAHCYPTPVWGSNSGLLEAAVVGGPLRSCLRCSNLTCQSESVRRVFCDNCHVASYCSEPCQVEDELFHRAECRRLQSMQYKIRISPQERVKLQLSRLELSRLTTDHLKRTNVDVDALASFLEHHLPFAIPVDEKKDPVAVEQLQQQQRQTQREETERAGVLHTKF